MAADVLVLYAVVGGGPEQSRADLEVRRGERVAVLFRRAEEPPARSAEAAAEYGRTLLGVEQDAMLPMRYGTVVPDEQALDDLVADNEETWLSRLELVTGRREMLVHLDLTEPTPVTGTSGRDYLMGLVGQRRRYAELAADLQRAVGTACRATRPLPSPRPRIACLVDAAATDDFLDSVNHWEQSHLVATVTGPWPPFTFAEPEEA